MSPPDEHDSPGVEIERKFLVGELPGDLGQYESDHIDQGYVAIGEDGVEVRLRRRGDRTLLTVKSGPGPVRVEEEMPIEERRFETLWPLTEGRRVIKTRYLVPLGSDLVVELDVYAGDLDGLLTAEIEFPVGAGVRRVRASRLARPGDHRRRAVRESVPRPARTATAV